MNIDFKRIGKAVLPVASLLLTLASTIVSNKQTEETIAKKVAEALADQAKES